MLDDHFTNPIQRRIFNMFREIIIGWKHVSELEKLLPPPSKDRVGKMDGIENANISFNKKTYVDALLPKGQVKERASERVILKNLL